MTATPNKPGPADSLIPRYLTHKKTPTPLGPPNEPRHGPTVGSYGVAVSHKNVAPRTVDDRSQFENNYFTETCGGFQAGSYSRLTDFVYHSTLG